MDSAAVLVGVAAGAIGGALTLAAVEVARMKHELRELRQALYNHDRSRGTLYRESLEDQRAVALRAATLVKLSATDQLNALAQLSPEMLAEVVAPYTGLEK